MLEYHCWINLCDGYFLPEVKTILQPWSKFNVLCIGVNISTVLLIRIDGNNLWETCNDKWKVFSSISFLTKIELHTF
jgi:hypothetical protein